MLVGVPIVVVMLPITWVLLTRLLFPAHRIAIQDAGSVITSELRELGPMTRAEKLVGIVFLVAALSWILREVLVSVTGLAINDTTIALIGALLLFAIPVSRSRGEFALDWEAARNVPWGVLLLFGGGLALVGGFSSPGLPSGSAQRSEGCGSAPCCWCCW